MSDRRFELAGVPKGARVAVAMSGGVDSSVCAALAREAGYQAIGITLQLYDHGRALGRKGACCAGADIHDARRVAERLAIPHFVLDYEKRFQAAVIDDFADAYARGETPAPCVRCNERVKFADLLRTARELGCAGLVTGHYARRVEGPRVGRLAAKGETRALAARFGLPVADKPDSQDLCFVPGGRYADVVARLRPEAMRPGDIVDEAGSVLGRHDGLAGFTVGQRRGLRLAGPEPRYVLRLEAEANRVVVGPRARLAAPRARLRAMNWLVEPPREPLAVSARVRSTRPPAAATATALDDGAEVAFAEPESAVAPGQACVLYAGTRVVGGGWIARA
jgi:tRNA-uridine 2-sulfurtransferase